MLCDFTSQKTAVFIATPLRTLLCHCISCLGILCGNVSALILAFFKLIKNNFSVEISVLLSWYATQNSSVDYFVYEDGTSIMSQNVGIKLLFCAVQ